MNKYLCIIFLFFFMFSHHVSGSSPRLANPVFQSLSTKNGLPQDVVNDISIDKEGFVWIATDVGVVRWDGTRTKIVHGPDDIFLNKSINKISVEGNKALWISTYSSGIFRFDLGTQRVSDEIAIPFSLKADWLQNAESFYWINNESLLIALPEKVIRYDTSTQSLHEIFSLDKAFITSNNTIRYAITVDEVLTLATTMGLYTVKLNEPNAPMVALNHLNGVAPNDGNLNVKYLLSDSKNRIWVGTVKGLFLTSKTDFLASVYESAPPVFTQLLQNRNIWTIQQAKSHTFWLGTNKGLFELERVNGVWEHEHILQPHNGRTELSDKRLVDIEQDNMGNLWLSSVYAGALYFGVKSADIDTIQNYSNGNSDELSDGVVWSLAQSDADSLWIGTENGLNQFDLNSRNIAQFITSLNPDVAEGDTLIEKILPTGDGRLFIQTYDGIRLFNPKTQQLVIPPLIDPSDATKFNAWNADITLGKDGFLYFTGDDFYRYSLHERRIETLPLDKSIFDIHFSVGFLGASTFHDNQLFLAMAGGLWLINPDTFEHELVYRFSEKQRANNRSITSWIIDDKGVLWLAFSGYGLFGIDADTFEPIYNLDDTNLLMSNIVYGLLQDSSGDIWFSSHSGLHRYSAASATVQHFIYGRELSVSEFNEGAALRLQDGRFAYGSTSGVVVFSPEELKLTTKAPSLISKQTAITEVVVDSKELDLPLLNLNNRHIELDYRDYGITIHFSALTMSGTGNIKYHYKLTRNNKPISEGVSIDEKITLANLEPGDYRFSVVPVAGSFEYTILPAALSMHMPYAPWRSPYAYGAYFILFMILFTGYILSRQRHLSRLQKAQHNALIFNDAFRQTRDWVIIFDHNKVPVAANTSFETIFGFNNNEPLAQQLNNLYQRHPNLRRQLSGKLTGLKAGEFYKEEAIIEGGDGTQYDVLVDVNAVRSQSSSDKSDHYLIVISDITELKNAERKLLKIANYDNLTGLVNRTLLLDRLEHALGHARQHEYRVAVMFIDLDRFKGINDSLGHDYGDKLLRVIANRMRNLVADLGTVARLGGDEFVIVIEEVSVTDELTSFVSQLMESVETPISIGDEVLRISCSIGVAFYPDDAVEAAELITHADVAMYSAKRDTMNGFSFFTSDMNDRAKQRLQSENLIKRAYSESCFYNHYQPIVDARNGKTIGVELLLRSKVDGEPVYPDVFIPILEQLRYIIEVTNLAMRRTAQDLTLWYAQGFTGFVSINLSALHFKSVFDLTEVLALLEEFNLPKEAFRFEITEGVLMDDSDKTLNQIQQFVDAGFVLALDDFGTGYSSLSYLKRYPLSVLKIDKSFVDEMDVSSTKDALVSTTITLASNLKMHCVAEGVETKEQAEILLSKGCYFHQGYFYAKPMSADDIKVFLIQQQ